MKNCFAIIILSALIFVLWAPSCSPNKADAEEDDFIIPKIEAQGISFEAAIKNDCPADMQEVVGWYCPEVSEICLKWLDADQRPEANGGEGPLRCAEFQKPSKCLSNTRKYIHYCMDKFEFPGEGSYPLVGINYYEAKLIAQSNNKRLCTLEEFNFAGEGEDMHPYAYGDGFHRDCSDTGCNCDKPWIDYTKFSQDSWNDLEGGLYQGVKSDSNSQCRNSSGIYNLNGNIDEILDSENSKNMILSGGYWGPIRARIRPKTRSHNKAFKFYQIGMRACKDIK